MFNSILLFAGAYMARILTTILHEIGHAIPALVFTEQEVIIYVGPNVKSKHTMSLRIGRLVFHIDALSVVGNGGVCYHSPSPRLYQEIIILFGGVALSVGVALITLFLLVFNDTDLVWLTAGMLLVGSAVFDVMINLIPNKAPFTLKNGEKVFNDGWQIRQFIKNGKMHDVVTLFNHKKYGEALSLFRMFKEKDYVSDEYYTMHLISLQKEQKYEEVLLFADKLEKVPGWSNCAMENRVSAYITLERFEQALQYSMEMLDKYPDYKYLLWCKAYLLGRKGEHIPAVECCDMLVASNYQLANIYEIRAYSLIMLEQFEAAFADLEKAKELRPENSYLQRTFGIYYLKTGDRIQAQYHLNKAYELDPGTEFLEDYLKIAYANFQ